ncbi:hypothetical protein LXL04_037142 [Taraxacum kok-saghyz]
MQDNEFEGRIPDFEQKSLKVKWPNVRDGIKGSAASSLMIPWECGPSRPALAISSPECSFPLSRLNFSRLAATIITLRSNQLNVFRQGSRLSSNEAAYGKAATFIRFQPNVTDQKIVCQDHMSGNWSLGSNYHPCSQSRKISIGVVVDSAAKTKCNNGKGVVTELQTSQNVTSAKDFPAERKHKGKEVISPDLGTQNEAPCQEPVHANTYFQNISHPDTISHPKLVSSLPSTSNVLLQASGKKIVSEKDPGSNFASQMFNLHGKNANEENSKRNTYQSEGGNQDVIGREEESSYVTPQKLIVPEKVITEQGISERGNSGHVTLRMKVQELLGTVYSPSKKQYNSETFPMDVNNSKPTSKTNKTDSQHLHKRETNSGSLGSRPVTRSFTRKKPQMQKSAPKTQVPVRPYKDAHLDKNVFSFVETWSKRSNTDADHGSTVSKRKERDIFGTASFMEGVHKDENQQATDARKRKSAAVNVSLFANRREDSGIVQPTTEMKEKTPHQFGGNKSTMLKNKTDQYPFPKYPLKNNVDPTFELKTAPRSLFHNKQEDRDADGLSERSFKTKGTRHSHSLGFSKGGHSNSNTKNFTTDPRDSVVKPATLNMGRHRESRSSRSSSKVVQSESSEDGTPVTGKIYLCCCYATWFLLSVSIIIKYPPFLFANLVGVTLENINGNRWSVSPCGEEVSESSEDGTPIKGNEECDKFHEISSEQDGVAGAVKLFALALQRIQSKMHSSTSRQSAEILLSVSKNIHSQLQNAESKIQNEVGKLTNLGKSKRMRPENQCQEQQEHLKRIYEKFKEEVDQHLEKCRSTLEGLEAHDIEVRGIIEKQRLSHRKLLLQTEEAIEAQLNDAQKRLSDVHRVAREKMVKLKYGIAECLKEGLLR